MKIIAMNSFFIWTLSSVETIFSDVSLFEAIRKLVVISLAQYIAFPLRCSWCLAVLSRCANFIGPRWLVRWRLDSYGRAETSVIIYEPTQQNPENGSPLNSLIVSYCVFLYMALITLLGWYYLISKETIHFPERFCTQIPVYTASQPRRTQNESSSF